MISSKLEQTTLHSWCRNSFMEESTQKRCTGMLILPGSLKDITVLRFEVMDGYPRAKSSVTLHNIVVVCICKICLLQPGVYGWGVLIPRMCPQGFFCCWWLFLLHTVHQRINLIPTYNIHIFIVKMWLLWGLWVEVGGFLGYRAGNAPDYIFGCTSSYFSLEPAAK